MVSRRWVGQSAGPTDCLFGNSLPDRLLRKVADVALTVLTATNLHFYISDANYFKTLVTVLRARNERRETLVSPTFLCISSLCFRAHSLKRIGLLDYSRPQDVPDFSQTSLSYTNNLKSIYFVRLSNKLIECVLCVRYLWDTIQIPSNIFGTRLTCNYGWTSSKRAWINNHVQRETSDWRKDRKRLWIVDYIASLFSLYLMWFIDFINSGKHSPVSYLLYFYTGTSLMSLCVEDLTRH